MWCLLLVNSFVPWESRESTLCIYGSSLLLLFCWWDVSHAMALYCP